MPKSLNFTYAFKCYHQKCKLASLQLAHPVYWYGATGKSAIIDKLGGNVQLMGADVIYRTIFDSNVAKPEVAAMLSSIADILWAC